MDGYPGTVISRRFRVMIEHDADDGAWVVYVPALNWLSTYGDTRDEAVGRAEEAILGYLEAAEKSGMTVPDDTGDPEVFDLEVAVP